MPIPITIPRLGWNMEEGTFVEWLKQDGDRIQAGDMLYKLEGEKATEDIECLDDGILSIPPGAPKPGDKIPVGTVIGYLLQANESVPVEPSTPAENGEGKEIHAALPNEGLSVPESIATSSDLPRIAISPRAKRVAKQLGIDWTTLRGTGRTGRIRERDVRAIPASHDTTQVHRRDSQNDRGTHGCQSSHHCAGDAHQFRRCHSFGSASQSVQSRWCRRSNCSQLYRFSSETRGISLEETSFAQLLLE